jgi:hypothetical protein
MTPSELLSGWDITGPRFKNAGKYLSKDGDNPEAPLPDYGWPLGSECWFFIMEGNGYRLFATGLTPSSALDRVLYLAARNKEIREAQQLREVVEPE